MKKCRSPGKCHLSAEHSAKNNLLYKYVLVGTFSWLLYIVVTVVHHSRTCCSAHKKIQQKYNKWVCVWHPRTFICVNMKRRCTNVKLAGSFQIKNDNYKKIIKEKNEVRSRMETLQFVVQNLLSCPDLKILMACFESLVVIIIYLH